ncbi:MAG: PAS domain-containing protein [Magnetococcales bacterium]|nr:PAS domain-containing protein [Magnetococcales bacterium]
MVPTTAEKSQKGDGGRMRAMNQRQTVSSDAQTSRAFLPRLVVGVLLINLTAFAMTGVALLNSRQEFQERAEITTRNLAQTLEESIRGMIQQVDLALLTVVDEVAHLENQGGLDPQRLAFFLERLQSRLPELVGPRMTDAQGRLLYGPGVNRDKPIDLSDRPFFQQGRDHPDAGLILSEPVLARLAQKWVLPMARRLTLADGAFAGVVYINLPLERLTGLFAAVDVGRHGSIALRDDALRLIIRHTKLSDSDVPVGDQSVTESLQKVFASGQSPVTFQSTPLLDHIPRTFTYRTIDGTPFRLLVGLAKQDYLAEWRRETLQLSALVLLIPLVSLVLSWLTWRAWRRQTAANAALQESEGRYRAVLEDQTDLICRFRPEGSFTFASETYCRFFNTSQEALRDGSWKPSAIPEDRPMIEAKLAQLAPSHPVVVIENRVTAGDGRLRWMQFVNRGFFDDSGTLREIQSVGRDVTERKEAEEALRVANERLALAAAVGNIGVWEWDAASGRLIWDRRMFQMYGLDPAAPPPTYEQWRAMVLPEDMARLESSLRMAFQEMREFAEALRIVTPAGEWRTIQVSAAVLRGGDGQGRGMIGVNLDITESQRIQTELQQAKEAAENASRAKSEFLAAMSHEIRTPLNVVLGMADLLLESAENDESRNYITKLQTAGGNLLELINQILDLSKVEAGELRLLEEPISLREVARQAVELLQVIAVGKGLRLTLEVDPALPPWIMGDELRLRQVLVNLVSNAVKFTEQGSVTVRVGLDEAAPTTLRVRVEDTGIGIGPEHLETIFDRFTQADASVTRRYGGTGLGLSLSKALVERMGGRLGVESDFGQGSAFTFHLPFRISPPPAALPGLPDSHPAASSDAIRPLRILLAEDSEDNQTLIRAFLKNTPHHVVCVDDGAEAVNRMRRESFDLALMDVQMPVMDGYTATRLIRLHEEQTSAAHRLPILSLTANALEGEAQRSQEAGCDFYLTKPIKKQRLLEVIQRFAQTPP